MTLTIDGIEIEIKVKKNGRTNANATKNFLNELACVYMDHSDQLHKEGYHAYAKGETRKQHDIHAALDALGYYDDVK